MLKLSKIGANMKKGMVPGTVMFLGKKKVENVKITAILYNETDFKEKTAADIKECIPVKDDSQVMWINIDGLHDTDLLNEIGKGFDLHPLLLEDVASTGQRPKTEDYGEYLFTVLKMIYFNHDDEIDIEQLSIVLGKNYVITFQEHEGDLFDPIRERLKDNKGHLRRKGADYLFYALMDVIIDSYFIILERTGDDVESIEEDLLNNPSPGTLKEIHNLKRRMMHLRKSIWPLRELVSGLLRSESKLIDETTRLFLRDAYDHTIQIIDTIESLRDIIAGMIDIYLSSISNKMNEVMKVLTIIATIFIPLTFIAGVYGMNFRYMPELEWPMGYFTALGVMLIIGILMVIFFKKKKWL